MEKSSDSGFFGMVNEEEVFFPSYLEIKPITRNELIRGVYTNGCGSVNWQVKLMKLISKLIKADLSVACHIHDVQYGDNLRHSRYAKLTADKDLSINIFRTLIRSPFSGPMTANFVSRAIHILLIMGGDKAWGDFKDKK